MTVLVLLVALGSYALGLLSGRTGADIAGSLITIQATTSVAGADTLAEAGARYARESASSSTIRAYVGAKTGNVYYPAGCAAATRIKLENRVYFASVADAVGAGRTLSEQCR